MSVLEIRNLRVNYGAAQGSRPAVDGLSLTVGSGEVVAIVGESGSGKSTTAHSVIGLLPEGATVRSDGILLGGTDIAGWSPKRLQGIRGTQIGLIPQDPSSSLDPVKTIGSQVGEALRIHKRGDRAAIRRTVLDLLARVGLPDPERLASLYPHELSGGMRQRALIASAIALNPRLIIADEATSALDVTVQRRILDLLDDLRLEFGTSILFITHDLGVAAERADRLIVMRGGKVEETGPVDAVLDAPQSDYTIRLVKDAPSLSVQEFRKPVPTASSDQEGLDLAISVRDLVKQFPGKNRAAGMFTAVDGVSFDVRRGTTHAIVGESGSGKTTTARIIARFETATTGSVHIEGRNVSRLRGEELRQLRRTVQMVYQNPFGSLDPLLSVGAIVAEPLLNFRLGNKQDRKASVTRLLDRVALPADVAHRKAHELSGGQRQRVAIARALAVNPEIVVLDEAVSALDVTVQAQILELLTELQSDLGLTYLFISHDLAVVRQVSDTISVMRQGRILESGPARQVLEHPEDEYTRELLAAVPDRSSRRTAFNSGHHEITHQTALEKV
jgi:peptide/nickel transport system ATP-binding protein